jgi:hypothetical protein
VITFRWRKKFVWVSVIIMKNYGVLHGVVVPWPWIILTHIVRTALMGLIGFLPTKGIFIFSWLSKTLTIANGAIGGVDYTPEERRKIAKE